jgi:hypothetical protein
MASLQTIKAGDIVEADVLGRRGFGIVEDKQPGKLLIRPISSGFTWRTVTSRQVVRHWRKTKVGVSAGAERSVMDDD